MAESERLRGSKSPVTDYKVGNGGIRDLFRYILGSDETRGSMKIVKTRGGKSTVITNPRQKSAVVNTVKKVMANNSNAVSNMAGERAANIQRRMAATMNQRVEPDRITGTDQTNRMRMMATYPGAVEKPVYTENRGPVVAPPGRVEVSNLPPAETMSPAPAETMSPEELELERRMEAERMAVEPVIRAGTSSRDGGGIPPEYSMGYDTRGKFNMGGYVKPKKKKKKKKLAGGGKVRSYNY